uniref:Uncharacterized protein n=1 Tax=Arundo donax TaxID=35708 RepID=A0A0A9GGE8_ARUDO
MVVYIYFTLKIAGSCSRQPSNTSW